ncbi:MAG: Uma2 family endonuclease [bacterium]|nr:Uma2 family endonuclease [bacterium]
MGVEDYPHYTYDDYLQWEGHWEVIYGIPFAMTPAPAVKHQLISNKIAGQLYNLLLNCNLCKALLPVDWVVDENTILQPDHLVVCSNKSDDFLGPKLCIPPVLIMEILSPATAHKDKYTKYKIYQKNGVKYYCIIDPETDSADVFVLQKDKYEGSDTFKDQLMRFDLEPCQIEFDFAKIFEI